MFSKAAKEPSPWHVIAPYQDKNKWKIVTKYLSSTYSVSTRERERGKQGIAWIRAAKYKSILDFCEYMLNSNYKD